MRRSIASFFTAALLFATVPFSGAKAAAPELLTGAPAETAATQNIPATAMRSRLVNVNVKALFKGGAARSAKDLPQVHFDLFSNAQFTGTVKSLETDGGTSTWSGTLDGVEKGYFYVVAVDGAVIMHVASPKGIYEVSNAGGDVYRVIQLNPQKNGEDYPRLLPVGPAPKAADVGSLADSGTMIDVVVLYTNAARAGEGSTALMRARVALAVAETNGSYANSGVTPRLRLVHTEEVSYAESGNIDTDLTRLVTPGDGYMDAAASIRNTYGGDMVSLIVENGGGYCGLANAIMSDANGPYDVTARTCATGYYSFGHEFGHLQGARHDTYVDPTNTPYAYGHGRTYPAGSWRTVMAYNNACQAAGTNCTRLQYFSNPTKTYGGAAMGVTGVSENYKVLNNTAYTVANFRTKVIGADFSSNFTNEHAGWTAKRGSWVDTPFYYRTVGLTNQFSSIVHDGVYGDLTYSARMKRIGCTGCPQYLIIRGNSSSLGSNNRWLPSYMFGYTNSGLFSVWKVLSGGTETPLASWTSSSAIVQGGSWNTLKVVAVGTDYRFYINGVAVWSGSEPGVAATVGQVGVAMYTNVSGNGNTFWLDNATLHHTPTSTDVSFAIPDVPPVAARGSSRGPN